MGQQYYMFPKETTWKDISFQLRQTWAAAVVLAKHLGWLAIPGFLDAMARQVRKGEPWQDLPPAWTFKERKSREQAGPVVIIYRLLEKRVGRDRALDITRELVIQAGTVFLASVVPTLSKADYRRLSEDQRRDTFGAALDAIPNSTATITEMGDESFGFDVTACEFQKLVRQLGLPELGALFCAVDHHFFQLHYPEVRFERNQTIAEGGSACDFRFSWRK